MPPDEQLAPGALGKVCESLGNISQRVGPLDRDGERARDDIGGQPLQCRRGRHGHDRGDFDRPPGQLLAGQAQRGDDAAAAGQQIRQLQAVAREVNDGVDAVGAQGGHRAIRPETGTGTAAGQHHAA